MTPHEEKARELVEKFKSLFMETITHYQSIECAKIAVDEILEICISEKRCKNILLQTGFILPQHLDDYWQQVRSELDKL